MIKNNKTKKNYLDGSVVQRYRTDLGLSTFNDGRGIFDWNVWIDSIDGPGNFVVTTDEFFVFVLVKIEFNFLVNVERNVSFEWIGRVKVFVDRRDNVITQSRALVVIIDVFNCSSFDGGWYVKWNASEVNFSNWVIIRSNRLNVEEIETRIKASGDW